MSEGLQNWLESGEYLPCALRDFHDQKDIVKGMHVLYRDSENAKNMPNPVDGHCYAVDWFLFYMASRGYTLQRSRKKVEFKEFYIDKPQFEILIKKLNQP